MVVVVAKNITSIPMLGIIHKLFDFLQGPSTKKSKKCCSNPNDTCIIAHGCIMEDAISGSDNTKTPDLDTWFQDHQMPLWMRPHDSWNQNHGSRKTNYMRDFRDSLTGEDFFENYLRRVHGNEKVSTVDGLEQRENHRGDVVLYHPQAGKTEFEVKLERKGAETGRHALEIGEYNTDHNGYIYNRRAPGWFWSSKADIVVPVVPMSDGTVVMYPYHINEMRKFLAKIAAQAEADGYSIRDENGKPDKEKMIKAIADMLAGSAHTFGPINTLREGGYKRSRSLCIPYELLSRAQLTKPYSIRFE